MPSLAPLNTVNSGIVIMTRNCLRGVRKTQDLWLLSNDMSISICDVDMKNEELWDKDGRSGVFIFWWRWWRHSKSCALSATRPLWSTLKSFLFLMPGSDVNFHESRRRFFTQSAASRWAAPGRLLWATSGLHLASSTFCHIPKAHKGWIPPTNHNWRHFSDLTCAHCYAP